MPLWVIMLEKDRYNDYIILENTKKTVFHAFLLVCFPEVVIVRARFLRNITPKLGVKHSGPKYKHKGNQ